MTEHTPEPMRRVLSLIAAYDWEGLIVFAQEHVRPPQLVSTNPWDYVLEGDYSGDARYVYPERQNLIAACARAALTKATEAPHV